MTWGVCVALFELHFADCNSLFCFCVITCLGHTYWHALRSSGVYSGGEQRSNRDRRDLFWCHRLRWRSARDSRARRASRTCPSSGQMLLHKLTSVRVHAFPKGFSADLDNGMVTASSSEGQTFHVIVDGVTIRPAGSPATSAQIAKVSPTEAILISTRGDLQVTLGEETKIVSSGSSYRLVLESEESSSSPNPQGPQPAGRNRRRFELILITLGAAAMGVLIWRATVSPVAP